MKPSYSEQRYFATTGQARRAAWREKMEKAAAEAHKRGEIAATLQIDDEALIDRIHTLGFDGETARVFDLLPLIHVCWADGKIQPAERLRICEVLEKRGIEPDSEPATLIASLLEVQPSEAFFQESLALVKRTLAGKIDAQKNVVDLCVLVAEASGGLLGLGDKVSNEERELLAQIAEALGEEAQAKVQASLS